MTGYGQGLAERDGIRVSAELKGVNHRFLDIKMRLPAELSLQESALRSLVQERVSRGRIDITVVLSSLRPVDFRLLVNRSLVAAYLNAATDLKREFKLKGSVALESLLALPGAISVQADTHCPDGPA